MASEELKRTVAQYQEYVRRKGVDEQVLSALCQAGQLALTPGEEYDKEYGLAITKYIKETINKLVVKVSGGDIWELEKYAQKEDKHYELINLYYQALLLETRYLFESFMFYMERNRMYEKRFYQPRRKTLGILVQDLQDLYEGKIRFLGISLPARTGKSTLCIFYMAWRMGLRPNAHNAMGGHSGLLAKGFYSELLNLIDTEEYTYKEIFPELVVDDSVIQRKSADEFTINLGEADRFATMTCRGIDGTWTGAIDVSGGSQENAGLLYIDDLVRDREHSLSPIRMETTYQEYLNKMVDRMSGDYAQQLMVGTLWSVIDPLMKTEQKYGGNPDYRFRKIPALDENDESNFNYEINGFSTKYYREMRDRLDSAEWCAKYQQEPFVREGLVFPLDELRYFNGIMPEGDYRIVAVVDVAWGGGDSLSMPIGREYDNGDIYIFDWLFDRGAKEVTVPKVVGKIIENDIRQCRFEGNVGGAMYSTYVDEELQKHDYKCNCTEKKAPNRMSKMEKIMAYSGDIKRNFIFLNTDGQINKAKKEDKQGIERYERSRDYQMAMDELGMFVSVGRNPHDDSADSLTQLAMFIEGAVTTPVVKAIKNPFRR